LVEFTKKPINFKENITNILWRAKLSINEVINHYKQLNTEVGRRVGIQSWRRARSSSLRRSQRKWSSMPRLSHWIS